MSRSGQARPGVQNAPDLCDMRARLPAVAPRSERRLGARSLEPVDHLRWSRPDAPMPRLHRCDRADVHQQSQNALIAATSPTSAWRCTAGSAASLARTAPRPCVSTRTWPYYTGCTTPVNPWPVRVLGDWASNPAVMATAGRPERADLRHVIDSGKQSAHPADSISPTQRAGPARRARAWFGSLGSPGIGDE
jgi:hypothetical protein